MTGSPAMPRAVPASESALPLEGIRILDFSSLVPGPLATLILAEAGAEVVKVERPGRGDEMRAYEPRLGADSANFALLNRGKRSITVDLKDPAALGELVDDLAAFDVLVEQFRPGVMARLGLGYEALSGRHPGLIYCSITGYGQDSPKAATAGHDLNYVGDAGLLDQIRSDGTPVLPHALLADIGGGAYPAVINILMALMARTRTGLGQHLDISMTDNVFPFLYWALAQGLGAHEWPVPGGELVTGGSPRYNIYEAADGRFIAAAPLEDRFWVNFCDVVGLEGSLRDDGVDPAATIDAVKTAIARQPSAVWAERFSSTDTCCSVVRTLEEAVRDPQFAHRRLFARRIVVDSQETVPALPVPVCSGLRRAEHVLSAPPLSAEEGNGGT
jgi:alpha-methylacyl-CoA racemase